MKQRGERKTTNVLGLEQRVMNDATLFCKPTFEENHQINHLRCKMLEERIWDVNLEYAWKCMVNINMKLDLRRAENARVFNYFSIMD